MTTTQLIRDVTALYLYGTETVPTNKLDDS